MTLSDARKKANRKWNENNLDRIYLTVKAGRKAEIQAAADEAGESLNAYIIKAINERLERDAAEKMNGGGK